MVQPAATSPTQWSTSQHSTMCIAFAINLSSATSERQKQIDNTHKDEARDTSNDPNNIVDSINHRNTTIGQSDDKLSMKILCGTFANSLCLFWLLQFVLWSEAQPFKVRSLFSLYCSRIHRKIDDEEVVITRVNEALACRLFCVSHLND